MVIQEFYNQLSDRLTAGEELMLCVVIATRGSTPQERGAKMIVLRSGQTIGTLGGGCVEAEVRQQALQLLEARRSDQFEFKLNHDYGWDDGLICGGVMKIAATFLPAADAPRFQKIAGALKDKQRISLTLPLSATESDADYVELLGPPPTLLIAGGGHVGQSLARIAAGLDFDVAVIDDRADIVSAERFPTARQRIVAEIEQGLQAFPIDAQTYVVIVTRGHRHDGRALAAIIDSPAKYFGLIGSKAKVKLIFDDLAAQGVDVGKLSRVHAPIGLNIGAVTVPEIALSIAAELVAIRRGQSLEVKEMKISPLKLRARLARSP